MRDNLIFLVPCWRSAASTIGVQECFKAMDALKAQALDGTADIAAAEAAAAAHCETKTRLEVCFAPVLARCLKLLC